MPKAKQPTASGQRGTKSRGPTSKTASQKDGGKFDLYVVPEGFPGIIVKQLSTADEAGRVTAEVSFTKEQINFLMQVGLNFLTSKGLISYMEEAAKTQYERYLEDVNVEDLPQA